MGKKKIITLSSFLIVIWVVTGSAFAEPLDNITAKFILNVTDTIVVGESKNKEAESLNLIAQNPPDLKRVSVPDVNGMNWREAKALLESRGLRVALNEVTALVNCDPSSAGKAIGVSAVGGGPADGTVEEGTPVTLSYCAERKREDRCGQIDAALIAASQAKDINRFRALVEQARVENCDFYQKAVEQYEKLQRCYQVLFELNFVVHSADITTFYTYDVKQFRALMEEAKALNCFFQKYYLYQDWLNRREQHDECCRQIDLALAAASKAKDINRFRALVEQARVEKCNFYQDANNYLRNWEQEL